MGSSPMLEVEENIEENRRIDNNSIDFRDRGGIQNPSYKSIKRLNTRRSVLCISKRIEREVRLNPVLS